MPPQDKKFAFVTSNDLGSFKNAAVKKLVRKHAMRETGKKRRATPGWGKHNLLQLPDTIQPVDSASNSDTPAERIFTRSQSPEDWISLSGGSSTSVPLSRDGSHIPDDADVPADDDSQVHRDAGRSALTRWNNANGAGSDIYRLGSGRLDPFLVYPVELSTRTKALLYDMFDDSFVGAWRVYTDFVFKQSLSDPAAFNQLMAVYIASRQLEQKHDPLYQEDESRKYHALALQSVNSRLETPGIAADDGILVAIVSFGAYYYLLSDYERWKLHMMGIRELVRLRGGFDRLFLQNMALGYMLMMNDIAVSYAQEIPCHFPAYAAVPPLPSEAEPPQSGIHLPVARQMSKLWRKANPTQLTVAKTIDALVTIISNLNPRRELVPGILQTMHNEMTSLWTGVVLHELLQAQPDSDVASGDTYIIQETFRWGVLVFMFEFKYVPEGMFFLLRNQPSRLRNLLSKHRQVDWGTFWPLKLWCVVMGAMCSPKDSAVRSWFVTELSGIMTYLESSNWRQMEQLVRKICWVDELFNEKADTLRTELDATGLDLQKFKPRVSPEMGSVDSHVSDNEVSSIDALARRFQQACNQTWHFG